MKRMFQHEVYLFSGLMLLDVIATVISSKISTQSKTDLPNKAVINYRILMKRLGMTKLCVNLSPIGYLAFKKLLNL